MGSSSAEISIPRTDNTDHYLSIYRRSSSSLSCRCERLCAGFSRVAPIQPGKRAPPDRADCEGSHPATPAEKIVPRSGNTTICLGRSIQIGQRLLYSWYLLLLSLFLKTHARNNNYIAATNSSIFNQAKIYLANIYVAKEFPYLRPTLY